jgi:hypothetical protein
MKESIWNEAGLMTRAGLKKLFVVCAATACALFNAHSASGQTVEGLPALSSQERTGLSPHLIGVVTAIDAANGQVTVTTNKGLAVTVSTNEKTTYLRLPPGETKLDRAAPITRADVRVGDRVLVPGGASATPARQLIVTSAAAPGSGAGRESEEAARARRVVGRVLRLDPERREFVVQARTREGVEDVHIMASGNARFMRFAPDSIRPADARQSSFAELKVGDQLRARGERSASDPTRFTADEVISGTFTRVGGQVSSVDVGRSEVTVRGEQPGETFIITVGRNSSLKRVSAEAAEAFAQRREGRRDERRAANGSNEGAQGGERRREGSGRGAGRDGERPRGGGGGGNIQQILESLPVVTLSELKKGDAVLVTGSTGADASRVTALMLITGDADFLRRLQRRVGDDLRNMSPGLPGSVLGGGTGSSSNSNEQP